VKGSKALNADPARLYTEEITSDYIAVVREPRYAEAPEYQNPDTRLQYLKDRGLRMLRKYQVNALKALQESVRAGNQRFLFEMATGTGKTLTLRQSYVCSYVAEMPIGFCFSLIVLSWKTRRKIISSIT
jgi:type I restriction enzyme R subunit